MDWCKQEEEDRQKDYLEAQIARAGERAGRDEGPSQATELNREENGGASLRMALQKSGMQKSRLSNGYVAKLKPTTAFHEDADGFTAGSQQGMTPHLQRTHCLTLSI